MLHNGVDILRMVESPKTKLPLNPGVGDRSLSGKLMARTALLYLKLCFGAFRPRKSWCQALSWRRRFIMALFIPAFAILETVHWCALWLDELLFPRYRLVPLNRPVFIVGIPRSGTTHLHRVLAEDRSRFTTPRLWEALFAPAICQKKAIMLASRIDRFLGAPLARLCGCITRWITGELTEIHELSLNQPEEDFVMLLPILACFLLIAPFPEAAEIADLARLDNQVPPQRRKEIMSFYRGMLQRHLYCYGANRTLLSKNVSFTPMLKTLLAAFPEARCIVCVRTPVRAIPSQISAMEDAWRFFGNSPQDRSFASRWVTVLREYYRHLAVILQSRNTPNIQCVEMEMMKEDMEAVVRRLYATFGMHICPDFAACLSKQAEASRQYRSRHTYSLRKYGLEAESVMQRFEPHWTALHALATGQQNAFREN